MGVATSLSQLSITSLRLYKQFVFPESRLLAIVLCWGDVFYPAIFKNLFKFLFFWLRLIFFSDRYHERPCACGM